jgi:hypothetical protein
VVRDVTIWYQIHGYNTDLGWAMLVEVEERVSKRIVVKVEKNRVLSIVSMLSLNGLDKWSLNLRFRVKFYLEEPNFGP